MFYQTSCKAGIILFPTCTLVISFWLPVPKSEREKKRRPELLQGVKDDTWLSWGVSLHALRTQAWLSSLPDGIEELLGRGSSLRSKKVCICKTALVLLCSSVKSIFLFRWVTDFLVHYLPSVSLKVFLSSGDRSQLFSLRIRTHLCSHSLPSVRKQRMGWQKGCCPEGRCLTH